MPTGPFLRGPHGPVLPPWAGLGGLGFFDGLGLLRVPALHITSQQQGRHRPLPSWGWGLQSGGRALPGEVSVVTVFSLCIFLCVIISALPASSLPATLSPDVSFKGELQSFV